MQKLRTGKLKRNMTADHGFLEGVPYARSMPLGFSVDHQGASFKDAFALPLHFDTTYLDPAYGHRYTSRFSYIPFPGHMGVYGYSFEPAFIRKRNERERQRVRCVNEGYARLREHLPQEFEDKRLSKVETLRAAVNYIKHMQSLLDAQVTNTEKGDRALSPANVRSSATTPQQTECNSDGESKHSFSDCGDLSC